MPAPSWKITLEYRNVFARLAKSSQGPRPCLWNFRLLSRSGGLLLEKLTNSFQIEASYHRPVSCRSLPEGGLLVPPPADSPPSMEGKRFLEIFSQGLFPRSWGRAWRHTRTGMAMLFGKAPASQSIRLHFLDVEKSNFCRPRKFGKKQTLTLHQVCLYPSLNGKEVGEVRPVRRQSPGASISSFRAILGRGMGSVHTPGH